jgi:transcriptional antiterminator RfaH
MLAHDNFPGLLWYAVKTKPQQEFRAEQSLRASEFETFVPAIRERSALRTGKQAGYRLAPLFPGYIFVRFAAERHVWSIRRTSGVHDVVNFGNGPAQVDDDVIELLRSRVAGAETRPHAPPLFPGQQVVIQEGPLRNLIGIFEREMGSSERVAILLSAIQARAVVDVHSLAKVDEARRGACAG